MKSSTYRILNEILNAVTHGVALGLSIVGLVFLLIKGAHISPLYIIAYTLYGSTLILLFLS
ncbi:MAG: hemolysin III family protein, partial [Lactobacillales bacterium]|nr:hemolysin III family protein [Lactobacillales bacterium]